MVLPVCCRLLFLCYFCWRVVFYLSSRWFLRTYILFWTSTSLSYNISTPRYFSFIYFFFNFNFTNFWAAELWAMSSMDKIGPSFSTKTTRSNTKRSTSYSHRRSPQILETLHLFNEISINYNFASNWFLPPECYTVVVLAVDVLMSKLFITFSGLSLLTKFVFFLRCVCRINQRQNETKTDAAYRNSVTVRCRSK